MNAAEISALVVAAIALMGAATSWLKAHATQAALNAHVKSAAGSAERLGP